MGALWQDMRYGFRVLARDPRFTTVAVLVLALGIGANTTIFSIVNGVVFRPLPYVDPGELVTIWGVNKELGLNKMWVSLPDFVDWRKDNDCFAHIAAYEYTSFTLKKADSPVSAGGCRVAAGFFPVMKVQPAFGRTFLEEHEKPASQTVAVISHRLWQNQFGTDTNLVGKTITLNEQLFTVIGIMPAGFDYPKGCDIWVPLNLQPDEKSNSRGYYHLEVIARLKPAVSLRQAKENMNLVASRLASAYPQTNKGYTVRLIPLHEQIVGSVKPILYVLLGAVSFVLLIACSNVANLLLARAATREREIAIRAAIGAGRVHLVLQLLVESMLLASLGCVFGLLLVFWSFDFILALSPWQIPRINEIRINSGVLLFAIFITFITGLVFGLAPLILAMRLNLTRVLNAQASNVTQGIHHHRFRSLLVIAEVALSVVLLVGAGLLTRSFVNLQNPDLGFDAKNLLIASISLSESEFANLSKAAAYIDQFITRVLSISGVEQICQTSVTPFSGSSRSPIYIEGKTDNLPPASLWIDRETVSANYFKNLRIPILRGRAFSEQDHISGLPVVIIDEALARRFWTDEDPVGRRFKIGRADANKPWLTIVGVVGTVKQNLFSNESLGKFYLPYLQNPDRSAVLLIRTASSSSGFAPPIQGLFKETFAENASLDIVTLEQILSSSFIFPGFITKLMSIFAGLALVMALAGIYGVVAYSVAQRSREIAIRMALGAQTKKIFQLILRRGLTLTLIGVAIGLVAACGLTRLLAGLLIDVTPTDPVTFVGVAVLLEVGTSLACYIPARRATKIDPMVVLRYE